MSFTARKMYNFLSCKTRDSIGMSVEHKQQELYHFSFIFFNFFHHQNKISASVPRLDFSRSLFNSTVIPHNLCVAFTIDGVADFLFVCCSLMKNYST